MSNLKVQFLQQMVQKLYRFICNKYWKIIVKLFVKTVVMKPIHPNDRKPLTQRSKGRLLANSKNKNKKKKEFNHSHILNYVIDLPTFNNQKKYKKCQKNITHTLLDSTPVISQNVSISKLRSKSSTLQYKKKDQINLKQLTNININYAITEEDLIKITQDVFIQNQQHIQPKKQPFKFKLCINTAAIRIQRFWRQRTTLKMVTKYYLLYKNQQKFSKSAKLDFKISTDKHINQHQHTQLEKTLKIKRKVNHSNNYLQNNNKNQAQTPHASRVSNFDGIMQWMRIKQAERWNEVMEILEKKQQSEKSEDILGKLIFKLQENKNLLENNVEDQISNFISPQFIKKNSGQSFSVNSDDIASIKQSEQYYQDENIQSKIPQVQQKIKIKQVLKREKSQQQSILQSKINQLCLKQLQQEKNIQKLRQNNIYTQKQINRQISQSNKRYNRQIKYIQQILNQYRNSLDAITTLSINIYKQKYFLTKSNSYKLIHKNFSQDSIPLKFVLQECKIRNSDIKESSANIGVKSSNSLVSKSQFDLLEHEMSEQQRQESVVSSKSEKLMKQCSQNFQQMIQRMLFDEIVQQIYLKDSFYKDFKHLIEKPFLFNQISDFQIIQFIEQIQKYRPEPTKWLYLFNQKINPTSPEILKIIREIDYELDEYELILDQQMFRMFRIDTEHNYQIKKDSMIICFKAIVHTNEHLKNKLFTRLQEKKIKLQRYLMFQKDLYIIYMKSVFNCMNEFLVEDKSYTSYMNGRSAIGPGQLKLALKQYNSPCSMQMTEKIYQNCKYKLKNTLKYKCIIPNFNNMYDLELFQKQAIQQMKQQLIDSQFRWVNIMDEILQIWHQISNDIIDCIFIETAIELHFLDKNKPPTNVN